MITAVDARVGQVRRELTAALTRAFAADGREGTPGLDVRLLLAHALGVDAAGLALRDDEPIGAKAETRAAAFVARRIAGEPVARIIGRQAFWSLDLEIGPDTLVPRPDTETVVEAALGFVDGDGRRDEALRILDIGTGSGAILLALLSELPEATGVGTDRAKGALGLARRNACRLGLAPRAGIILGDWAAAVGGGFDLVVSNPPYVESDAIVGLSVEVREHDPYFALDGGADGFDAYRAILTDLDRLLADRGRAFLEIGRGQAESVSVLAAENGFLAGFHRDLAGTERVAEIRRVGDD